jgi:electron transfer flavoprotein alpha subunit
VSDGTAYRNIWVFMERRLARVPSAAGGSLLQKSDVRTAGGRNSDVRGPIHPVSFELLSAGNRLKRSLGEKLVSVFFGDIGEREMEECAEYGADEVLCLSMGMAPERSYEAMAVVLSRAAEERRPSVLLAGATMLGRSLMPLVAVRLGTGLTADCTELTVDEERGLLLQTRPAFGGNILATIVCPDTRPQMATVRPHVFKMEKAARTAGGGRSSPERAGLRVIRAGYETGSIRIAEVLETVLEGEESDITESDVIVAGGRGLGKPEGFELVGELARRLGGVVGASRGAVDLGWIGAAHQVGQTGHTVNPKLYVACGISGAIQHIAGMKGAELIVAINLDPDAPIFQFADYGIVGDLYEIVPRVIGALEGGAGR